MAYNCEMDSQSLSLHVLENAARVLPGLLQDSTYVRAREFALLAHGGQMYGKEPYVVHLDIVAGLAAHYGLSRPYILAAFLHDTVEDTGTAIEQLRLEFGDEVADLVDSVSGVGANRKEQGQSIRAKLLARPEHAGLKLMDRLGNAAKARADGLMHLVRMYRKEASLYADLFSAAHPAAAAHLDAILQG